MAYYDRDYYREEDDVGGGFRRQWVGMSVTTWIIGINVAVFLLTTILSGSRRAAPVSPEEWGLFNIRDGVFGLQLWRWVTYQFIHGGIFHLFFNMLLLYYFGKFVEQWWGSRRYLAFYLICGVFAAAVFTALAYVPKLLGVGPDSQLFGASGAVLAVIVCCAVIAPHQTVSIWGVFTMTVRTLAYVTLGISVLSLAVGSMNAGGEAAHLGGAMLGFVFVKNPWLLNWADGKWAKGVSPRRVRQKIQKNRWERKMQAERELEEEVDRILAKVARQGLQSLNWKEKRTLQRATEKQRQE